MSNAEYGEVPRASLRDQPRVREEPRWRWWLGGTGAIAAILLIATLVSPWVRHEWALSLSRQTTPYTQLAFNSAAGLPATAVRGQGIPVSFTITNDEGQPVSYQYVVASGSGTQLKTLSTSTETVSSGATWVVDINVVPECTKTDCRVQVSLPKQGESIRFMFNIKDKSAAKK